MTRQHYHVVENTPGYLPEDENPLVTTNRRAAEAYAAILGRELREQGYHRTGGSAREGLMYFELNADDLGRVIEIMPCTEADCIVEGEDECTR